MKECLYDLGDCCQTVIDDSECNQCLCQHYGIKFPTIDGDVPVFRRDNALVLDNKRPINPQRLKFVVEGHVNEVTFKGK